MDNDIGPQTDGVDGASAVYSVTGQQRLHSSIPHQQQLHNPVHDQQCSGALEDESHQKYFGEESLSTFALVNEQGPASPTYSASPDSDIDDFLESQEDTFNFIQRLPSGKLGSN